jgi:hypothetical protein
MSEPLNIFGKDDPVTCAVYAREHGLLEEEGWKRFKGIAKREKKMIRMVNQSRIKTTRNAPRYKFGYRIPRNYDEAMQFDLKNGNTLWREATGLEMLQLAEFDTFRDLGHKDTASPPTGYKKIRTHLIYDCKHDGRHKAWMVADGHLMDIPLESIYSGVVSLRGLQIVTFLTGHYLVIVKALYGLCTSGLHWHVNTSPIVSTMKASCLARQILISG